MKTRVFYFVICCVLVLVVVFLIHPLIRLSLLGSTLTEQSIRLNKLSIGNFKVVSLTSVEVQSIVLHPAKNAEVLVKRVVCTPRYSGVLSLEIVNIEIIFKDITFTAFFGADKNGERLSYHVPRITARVLIDGNDFTIPPVTFALDSDATVLLECSKQENFIDAYINFTVSHDFLMQKEIPPLLQKPFNLSNLEHHCVVSVQGPLKTAQVNIVTDLLNITFGHNIQSIFNT